MTKPARPKRRELEAQLVEAQQQRDRAIARAEKAEAALAQTAAATRVQPAPWHARITAPVRAYADDLARAVGL